MGFKHAFDADGPEAGKWEISGRIIRPSPSGKAVLFDDGVSQQWLPKSKIHIGPADKTGVVSVYLPEWLAREKKYV